MKKKHLLLSLIMTFAFTLDAMADNKVYTYKAKDGESPLLGSLRRISDNGKWAAGGDYADESGSFIINLEDPENIIRISDGVLFDIADDGTAVGSWYENLGTASEPVNYERAAIYKDGKWIRLFEPEDCVGRSNAVSITPDGKRISGHAFCHAADVETGGKYYPMVWDWNEDEQMYIPTVYNKIGVPEGQQGFFTSHMTPDGSIICGYVFAGFFSTLPAIVKDGELKIWNKVETRQEPFYYKDKLLGYSEEYYIDGMHDGFTDYSHRGNLAYATDKYLFGQRTIITNPNYEEGTGTYNYKGTVYDIEKDEFIDSKFDMFICGIDPNTAFGTRAYIDGVGQDLEKAFDFKCDMMVAGLYDISKDQKILAGSTAFFNEVMGEYVESPMLVLIDKSDTGISDVTADSNNAVVTVGAGTISVTGATKVAIYNAAGALVSVSDNVEVASGIYVVVADGKATKVSVK